MSTSVEYIFAADLRIADEAARKQGWHAYAARDGSSPTPFRSVSSASKSNSP
jgi:hypothetical protein